MGLHRRRVWEIARGFRGRAKNCIKIARQQAEKALQHAYTGRKDKKGEARSLWVTRINAGARQHGIKYSHLISGLRDENVQLNRKMLSELAMYEPHSFKALVEQVQFMRGRPGLNGADAGLSSRISVGSLPLPPPQQQQQLESGGGHSSSSSRGGAGSSNSSGLGVS